MVTPMINKRRMSSKQASEELGVHPHTLRRWLKSGQITAIETGGGQFRYDVEAYLAAQQKSEQPPATEGIGGQAEVKPE